MGIIYKNGTYYGGGSGGGAEITIDNELSSISENPVQNKVIKAELDNKQDADDLMTSADIDDVVTPLPGVASRLPRYSTEEQMVGYWIDGKPIYQKTINFGALPNSTAKNVAHGIANLNQITDITAIGYDGNYWSFNFAAETTIYFIYVGTTDIVIWCNKDKSTATAYVTLQYTKTTD